MVTGPRRLHYLRIALPYAMKWGTIGSRVQYSFNWGRWREREEITRGQWNIIRRVSTYLGKLGINTELHIVFGTSASWPYIGERSLRQQHPIRKASHSQRN